MSGTERIHAEVAAYYDRRLGAHGATPRGVDWNGAEGQRLRFEQLARVIGPDRPYALNDLGCGYGAMLDFLRECHGEGCRYAGWDVSAAMVDEARRLHAADALARFAVGGRPGEEADYGVASGIFNVRGEVADDRWLAYVEETLDALHETSRRGFAFNCLTSWSDRERMQDYLYYADPARLFERCKRLYARDVALLHDYGLYEFTILVRKRP